MRILIAVGICDESGPYIYLANNVTREFLSGGLSDGVKYMFVIPSVNSKSNLLTV